MYPFLLILLLFIAASFVVVKNVRADSFILSKSLNSYVLGLSAGATANSGFIVIGAVGMGYSMGLYSLLFPISWLIGDLVFWNFFSKKIVMLSTDKSILSVPELITSGLTQTEKLKKVPLQQILGGIIAFFLLAYLVAQFSSIEKATSNFIDLNSSVIMIIALVAIIIYSSIGGFVASVATDLLQGSLMILLTTFILIWGIVHLGGIGLTLNKLSTLDPSLLDLNGEMTLTASLIFVIGFAFTAFGFNMSQPQMTTRFMAARDTIHITKAKYVYIAFLQYTWVGMCMIGLLIRLIIPDIQDPEIALPILAKTYFSPFIASFVLAGMLAAIVSTLDSLLVSIANSLSHDVFRSSQKRNGLIISRVVMLVTGIFAIGLSTFVSSSVFSLSLLSAGLLAGTIGVLVTMKVIYKVLDKKIVIYSLIGGIIVVLSWREFQPVASISEGMAAFVVSSLIYILSTRFKLKSN